MTDKYATAKAVLGLDDEAFEKADGTRWPHAAHEDGWMHAHNNCRFDIDTLSASLRSLEAFTKDAPLKDWQVEHLKKLFRHQFEFVHHHHDNEEKLFFPWAKTKGCVIPDKICDDHISLVAQLDAVKVAVDSLKASGNKDADRSAVQAIIALNDAYAPKMKEHLLEEECVALPIIRAKTTHKEIQVPTKELLKSATPQSLGYMLRCMGKDDALRRRFMVQEGIPRPVQSLILLPACRKQQREWEKLVTELQSGERVVSTGCCG